jgi:hypothetical protein
MTPTGRWAPGGPGPALDLVCPRFGTPFRVDALAPEAIARFSAPAPCPNLFLPARNPYIPDSLVVKPLPPAAAPKAAPVER